MERCVLGHGGCAGHPSKPVTCSCVLETWLRPVEWHNVLRQPSVSETLINYSLERLQLMQNKQERKNARCPLFLGKAGHTNSSPSTRDCLVPDKEWLTGFLNILSIGQSNTQAVQDIFQCPLQVTITIWRNVLGPNDSTIQSWLHSHKQPWC